MKKLALVGAAALGLALPAVASAHQASVACVDGEYVVTADYRHLNPTNTFTDTTVTVRWSDGYRLVLTLPRPCELPPPPPPVTPPTPTPPPVPPVPEVTPPEPPKPPTCAELKARYPKAGKARLKQWGCPADPRKAKTTVERKRITVKTVPCYRSPNGRAYRYDRIVVRWYTDGELTATRFSKYIRVNGNRCSLAVTG